MKYRAWARAGTALLMATTPQFSAFAQAPATSSSSLASAPAVPVLNPAAQAALQKAISGSQRIEPSRDRWRSPAATLQFFGVRPTDTVYEIWPGQGWYTSILGPYLKQGTGSLVVGHFDASSTNSSVVRQIVDAYRARFASDQNTYGAVNVVPFGPRSGPLGLPGTADSVLTFRNIHNWMAQGWAEKAFGDFFYVLKPGGILGIEEHRGRTDEPQDPLAREGYVREDYVIQLAREAGFEFVGRSEINANPADTKDHPFGVWTLPPVSRTSALGQRDDPGFDRTRYNAIGESDRMTLRFRKPLSATSAPPSPGTRWSPVIVAPAPPPPPPAPRPSPPVVRPPVIVAAPVIRPTAPTPRPASGPTVSTSPSQNGEAAPPRATEPTPKAGPVSVPPRIQSPPPVVAAPPSVAASQSPIAPSPAPVVPTTPRVESRPLVPVVTPTAPTTNATTLPAPQPIIPSPPPPPLSPPTSVEAVPAVTQPSVVLPSTSETTPAAKPPTPAPAVVAPAPARPSVATPRPAPTPRVRPAKSPPPAAVRATPRPPPPPAPPPPARPAANVVQATAAPNPKRAAPVVRPAPARPVAAPAPKAKSKAKTVPPTPLPARPTTRPPPSAPPPKKKAAPAPQVDPNKPDWVVPRRRS